MDKFYILFFLQFFLYILLYLFLQLLLIWATCPEYERAKSLLLNSPEIKQIDAENSQLYEELSNYTGHTIASAEQVFDLYSTLYAEV